jgi:hypothetical protein
MRKFSPKNANSIIVKKITIVLDNLKEVDPNKYKDFNKLIELWKDGKFTLYGNNLRIEILELVNPFNA